jgi:hypothetical protein
MSTLTTTLVSLQASAVSLLGADDYFSGVVSKPIPIITEKKGDILSQIRACLGSVGICALVMTPMFEFHNNLTQDLSGWALITITIYEDATVNQSSQGSGIFGIALAERTVAVLQWAEHGVPTGATNSPPRFLGVNRPIEMISEGPPLQFNVSFQAHVTLNPIYT